MSTITDSLKNFYKKLGGSLSNLGPNSTSADIVDAMAEVYTDKEGTYVEVTEAVTEGTKIATIKTNNVDHDIYAPVELPTVTSSDEGKILTVDGNGDWGAANAPTELPAVTSADEGKVLSVDSNGAWVADDVPSELPAVTSADEGKVLTVDSNGDWGADDVPSELPAVTSADEGKILAVDSNGAWVASGNNVLIIEAQMEANNTLVFEKTISVLFSEITTAINSGKYVIIKAYKEMVPQHTRVMSQFYTLNAITLSNIYFIYINRGTNSTIYNFFDIPESVSGTTIQYTSVTVNDPT